MAPVTRNGLGQVDVAPITCDGLGQVDVAPGGGLSHAGTQGLPSPEVHGPFKLNSTPEVDWCTVGSVFPCPAGLCIYYSGPHCRSDPLCDRPTDCLRRLSLETLICSLASSRFSPLAPFCTDACAKASTKNRRRACSQFFTRSD